MLEHHASLESKDLKLALIGSPNCGKTTLYNWLTNSNFKAVNYPGSTVEFAVGPVNPVLGSDLIFMDTPGLYSLFPKSFDEEVTLNSLYNNKLIGDIDGILVIVDGTQMERHLLLAQQVKETGFPMAIVVTMKDLLRRADYKIHLEALEKEFDCPVIQFDGHLGEGLTEVIHRAKMTAAKSEKKKIHPRVEKWSDEKSEKQAHRRTLLTQKTMTRGAVKSIRHNTDQLDHFLMHPFLGLVIFFGLMTFVFSSIYWFSSPFMDFIDQGFSELADAILKISPDSLWADFLSNGIIASFSAVLIFVPQIFILFLGVGLLESSGYLARAATLIDKPLSKLGLSGRSFVPILSGFACAVPALMATRNLNSRRDRLITQMIIPLMTCSARLPVYALLISFLYPDRPFYAGLMLTALYFGALILGAVAAAVLNKIIAKDQGSYFMMELPLYRWPKASVIFKQTLLRTKSYIWRAGPVIFLFAMIVWAATNFPKSDVPEHQLEHSIAGQVGHVIEPVFKPMGVDWRVGVGLLSAFAAREVFVSSMAVIFQAANDNEDTQREALLGQMQQARNSEGELIFTVSTVIGLAVFFMIALQCMSTVAMMQKESGSTNMALLQLVAFNVIAYILAVGLVQGLRFLGVS